MHEMREPDGGIIGTMNLECMVLVYSPQKSSFNATSSVHFCIDIPESSIDPRVEIRSLPLRNHSSSEISDRSPIKRKSRRH